MAKEITLLIADDAEDMHAVLEASLQTLGVRVVGHAFRGDEVVDCVRATKPDIVLLDVHMPGIDGLQVLSGLVGLGVHDYVVMLSADANIEVMQRALASGSRGYIVKPYSVAKLQQMLQRYRQSQGSEQDSALVYIADDEPLSRGLLRQMLREQGLLLVEEFGSADELMQRMVQKTPDLVFLDIEMPGVSGMQALQEIKQRFPEVYVVMASAHNSLDNVKYAVDDGAGAFFAKPFDKNKLQTILGKFQAK